MKRFGQIVLAGLLAVSLVMEPMTAIAAEQNEELLLLDEAAVYSEAEEEAEVPAAFTEDEIVEDVEAVSDDFTNDSEESLIVIDESLDGEEETEENNDETISANDCAAVNVEEIDATGAAKKVAKKIKLDKKSGFVFNKKVSNTTPLELTVTGTLKGDWTDDELEVTVSEKGKALVSVAGLNISTDKTSFSFKISGAPAQATNATGKAKVVVSSKNKKKLKATFTVSVCNPASKVSVADGKNYFGYVSRGKSYKVKATVSKDNGKLRKGGVKWTAGDIYGNPIPGVTINSSGVLKCKTTVADGTKIRIVATAKDGCGLTASRDISVTTGVKTVGIYGSYRDVWGITHENCLLPSPLLAKTKNYMIKCGDSDDGSYFAEARAKINVNGTTQYVVPAGGFKISASSKNVITTDSNAKGIFTITFLKTGTYKVTLRAKDGSGAKRSVTFIVDK